MGATTLTTKDNIRQTAEKLFRERGYAAIGMRELAREVGIEAPSIYNHYKSKDDLLREICFDIAEQFFAAFDKAVAGEDKPMKKLRAAIRAHIGVISANIYSSEVFFNEWVFLEEPNLSKFKKMRYEYEMKFRDIIDRGVKKGDFKKLNTKLAAFTIFSALNATYDLYKSSERMNTDEIAEEISNLLLKGLKA
ncbi:MAG: TetR family transcriptional regulator [Chitinophagales bacterium]|nr:TetR family transcriptional regulator [Chitinophagales bacterium]